MTIIESNFTMASDGEPPPNNNIAIEVQGTTGVEQYMVVVGAPHDGEGGIKYRPRTVGTQPETHLYDVPPQLWDRIQVHFLNDGNEPADRNLAVYSVSALDGSFWVGGDDPDVWSTGTYVWPEGFRDGFGLGPWLHGNGHLDFSSAVSRELPGPPPEPEPEPEPEPDPEPDPEPEPPPPDYDRAVSFLANANGISVEFDDGTMVFWEWTT